MVFNRTGSYYVCKPDPTINEFLNGTMEDQPRWITVHLVFDTVDTWSSRLGNLEIDEALEMIRRVGRLCEGDRDGRFPA